METEEQYFSFIVKTDFTESHHRFDQCGIVMYLDSENWIKGSVEYENESFQHLGEACKTLKNALSYHKNEDNMNVIGILADAITQIVNDDNGGSTEGGEEPDEEENDVISDVEKEYSPAGGEGGEEGPEANGGENEAPNPAEMGEPEPF